MENKKYFCHPTGKMNQDFQMDDEQKNPVFARQLKTYLVLMNKHIGLLLNFGQLKMVNGIERIVNGYE